MRKEHLTFYTKLQCSRCNNVPVVLLRVSAFPPTGARGLQGARFWLLSLGCNTRLDIDALHFRGYLPSRLPYTMAFIGNWMVTARGLWLVRPATYDSFHITTAWRSSRRGQGKEIWQKRDQGPDRVSERTTREASYTATGATTAPRRSSRAGLSSLFGKLRNAVIVNILLILGRRRAFERRCLLRRRFLSCGTGICLLRRGFGGSPGWLYFTSLFLSSSEAA